MPELVDTHCHIQSAGLAASRNAGERVTRELWAKSPELTGDGIVAAAVEAGVTRLVCVGCSLHDSRLAIDFVQEHEGCYAAAGVHPHEAATHLHGEVLAAFAALTAKPKVIAVGECGLDFYYSHSPKEDQVKVLEFQLEVAREAGLPVLFHVREAFDDFWPIFDNYKGLHGVLHSFTDSAENLAKALERGLHIGVNGIATFTKDEAQLEVYKSIPLSRLLLETDSPFLSPKPHRGQTNQPKLLVEVANFLADLRGEDPGALAAATTANARRLLRI